MHLGNPEIDNFGTWVALPQYVFMGLFLGYITLKDHGLELAIGVHAANNIISGITYTSDATALQTHALFKDLNPTSSHWDTLVLVVFTLIFITISNYKYRYINYKQFLKL
jgi:membrane protease YdiL (CAAX protease family)